MAELGGSGNNDRHTWLAPIASFRAQTFAEAAADSSEQPFGASSGNFFRRNPSVFLFLSHSLFLTFWLAEVVPLTSCLFIPQGSL